MFRDSAATGVKESGDQYRTLYLHVLSTIFLQFHLWVRNSLAIAMSAAMLQDSSDPFALMGLLGAELKLHLLPLHAT